MPFGEARRKLLAVFAGADHWETEGGGGVLVRAALPSLGAMPATSFPLRFAAAGSRVTGTSGEIPRILLASAVLPAVQIGERCLRQSDFEFER